MSSFIWILVGTAIAPFAGLITMIIFYEWRRKERIRRGLPVDDREGEGSKEPAGFEVERKAGP